MTTGVLHKTTRHGQASETAPTIHIAGGFGDEEPKDYGYEAQVTVHEIELLCHYWAEQILRGYEEWARYRSNGSSDIRVEPYAWWRLSYFAQLRGEGRVKAILDDVFKNYDPADTPVLGVQEGSKPSSDAIKSDAAIKRQRRVE